MGVYCQSGSRRQGEKVQDETGEKKRYSQTYDIDYDETFVPVAKMGTMRILVSCATNFNYQ
jgi:cytidylate kinase